MQFRIKGLVKTESLQSMPEEALVPERLSPYDDVIDAVKTDNQEAIRLTFECNQRASTASYSLRARARKRGEKMTVLQRADRVYIYEPKAPDHDQT